jgi:hypothetical protein
MMFGIYVRLWYVCEGCVTHVISEGCTDVQLSVDEIVLFLNFTSIRPYESTIRQVTLETNEIHNLPVSICVSRTDMNTFIGHSISVITSLL